MTSAQVLLLHVVAFAIYPHATGVVSLFVNALH